MSAHSALTDSLVSKVVTVAERDLARVGIDGICHANELVVTGFR